MKSKYTALVVSAGMLFIGATVAQAASSSNGNDMDNAMQSMSSGIDNAARSVGKVIDDSAITTSIKTQYVKESSLSAFKISVETTDGVVTLSGTVDNTAQYQRAVDIATKTDGVKSVNAVELKVVTPTT